jgi:hypothetical protein
MFEDCKRASEQCRVLKDETTKYLARQPNSVLNPAVCAEILTFDPKKMMA